MGRLGFSDAIASIGSSGALVTPPQFDNSVAPATTAFVQRALGNFQGSVSLSAAATLTLAQSGTFFELIGSASFTITLPAPASGKGTRYTFYNAATAAVTVATPSGYLYNGNAVYSSISIASGGSLDILGDGTNWLVMSGLSPALLTAAGYQRLPSGLILQWATVQSNGTAANNAPVTWPIAFPTACLAAVQAILGAASGVYTVQQGTLSKTGGLFTCLNSSTFASNISFAYFAVGS